MTEIMMGIDENENVFELHWRLTLTVSKDGIFRREGITQRGTKTMWH
jgi:hypothetical protein